MVAGGRWLHRLVRPLSHDPLRSQSCVATTDCRSFLIVLVSRGTGQLDPLNSAKLQTNACVRSARRCRVDMGPSLAMT